MESTLPRERENVRRRFVRSRANASCLSALDLHDGRCTGGSFHERKARADPKRGHVPALFGDVDVAALVDPEQIRDRVAWPDLSQVRAIARAEDMHVDVGHEERSGSQDGLKAARNVGLDRPTERVAVTNGSRRRVADDAVTRRRITDEHIVPREPRGTDRCDRGLGLEELRSCLTVEGGEA